ARRTPGDGHSCLSSGVGWVERVTGRRAKSPRAPRFSFALLGGHKMRAAVLLPAALVVLGAERPLLAVAHRAHPSGVDSQRDQEFLRGLGAFGSQRQVVFQRAPLVAVALDGYLRLRVAPQKLRGLRQRIARVRPDVVFVVLEERVLHVLPEKLVKRQR